MWPKTKRLLGNFLLTTLSLLACLAFLEHVVFKYVLVPDDVFRNVTINNVVRYQPNTRGVFRQPDGQTHLVTVNADGWNSTKPRYAVEKTPGVLRVAVVGDSYVHAATVDVDKNFAHLIEKRLNAKGVPAEVYRFAVDGAPLSQYLHMLRREVLRHRPDVVIFQLIHNDFDESYRFLRGRYASSFMKVRPDGDMRFTEVAPRDFEPGYADIARDFRTFRYLYYETGLYKNIGNLVSRFWWGSDAQASNEAFVSSAVDIRNIREHDKIRRVSGYLLREIKKLAERHGFKPAFVMDGVREAVYSGKDRKAYEVSALNEIAAALTRELELPFLDLQDMFAAHYRTHGKRFEYSWDWHWNRLGNRLVAEATVDLLCRDPRLLAKTPRAYSSVSASRSARRAAATVR